MGIVQEFLSKSYFTKIDTDCAVFIYCCNIKENAKN